MKLLYVSNWYEPAWQAGGPPRSASALCRALVDEGIDVTVLTTDNNQTERLPVQTGVTQSVGGVRVVYFHAHGGPHMLFSSALATLPLPGSRGLRTWSTSTRGGSIPLRRQQPCAAPSTFPI